MNYRDALKKCEQNLINAGITEAKLDAWLLMSYTAKIDRSFYYTHMDEPMPEDLEHDFFASVDKRTEHVPLQYITGEQGFMGLTFNVNTNVLIPRQDTETLVEAALKIIRPEYRVLDMCTGSGCIIISIKYNVPEVVATGSDISKQALLVAKDNAKKYGMNIDFITGNLFDNISGDFDVIVSNPPYIPTTDILTLMPEVRDFEPIGALDGGADGLEIYRQLIAGAKDHLREGGALLLEIGYNQAADVTSLMRENGFVAVEVIKDLSGHDRVVTGIR
ncbi:MAG: peptide chain release factor N(5)-glutamine methyltransferase [Lachnospiraceae bacterium]|nr:peptide chain release factor N(5)-glutamine methyltransferase [Lachnospiraceae bacterium]